MLMGPWNDTRPNWLPKAVPRSLGSTMKRLSAQLFVFKSIRSIIALEAQHKLQLHRMDVSTAFLHGELTAEVYMTQPEGYIEPGKEHLVFHLKHSIYGLKQSPRCWNHALDSQLKKMGFKHTSSDPCLYVYFNSEGVMFLVAVYVDDIVLRGRNEAEMNAIRKS